MKNKRIKQGFTLIELLVVVLIIGILASVALPQYQKAVRKSRLTEVATVYNTLTRGMDMWTLENGFPASEVWFSGVNKDVELDISPAWTEEGTAYRVSYTKIGAWQFMCGVTGCHIAFYGEKWINNSNLFWMRTPNSDWYLYDFDTNDNPLHPELCRWWRDLYGTDKIKKSAATVCAPYL